MCFVLYILSFPNIDMSQIFEIRHRGGHARLSDIVYK